MREHGLPKRRKRGFVELTYRETWTLVHGLILGTTFLLAFAGGLAGLYSFRPALVTQAGIAERLLRLRIGMSVMAIVAWLTVITGTWIVYPWYREPTDDSPRSLLLADPDTEQWHTFGMEWKEHVAWISPMLATAAAFLVLYYGAGLVRDRGLRTLTIVLFVGAFVTAGVAGLLGALITKAAPVT